MKKIRQGLVPAALIAAGSRRSRRHTACREPWSAAATCENPLHRRHAPDGISLDEAVRRAEAQYRARVVRTEVQDEDGRKVYVLKLLSENGRVITVRIDAATGRMR